MLRRWQKWRASWWALPAVQLVLLMGLSSALRAGLWLAYGLAGAGWGSVIEVMGHGLVADLVVASVVVTPLVLWCSVRRKPWTGWARRGLTAGLGLAWLVQCFLFVSEGFFFDEFLSRFNTVAIDYLIYPTDVVTNLQESYPVGAILAGCAALAAFLTWGSLRVAPPVPAPAAGRGRRLLGWTGAVVLLASGLRVPDLKPGLERVANELSSNGALSGLSAAWSRHLPYEVFYATLPRDEAWALARSVLAGHGGEFTAPQPPPLPAAGPDDAWFEAARASLQRHIPGDPDRPKLNVCILLEESLGSEFFGSLGRVTKKGKPDTLTPRMDQLIREEGMLFDQVYADGNRTIRGFEAVFSSFPPLPGDSILARDRTENVETVARVLKRDGYQSLFLYGGHGTFDFIKSYVLPNGWDRLIEQGDFKDPVFTTAWGVSDEDLYHRGLEEMRAMHRTGKPFLVSFMTVSNHRPFSFPAGRIAEDPMAKSRKHAVKYADWALGEFFAAAKQEPFWKDTIFVVVADHGARVYGSQTIPLKSYEIPFVVLGPAVVAAPVRISELGCQLDVTPTLLGLIGRPYDSLFFGRDLRQPGTGPGRVLMHHNRSIGSYENGRLVVFGLNQQVSVWGGSLRGGDLLPLPQADAVAARTARHGMALFRVADDLYLQRRYRVLPASGISATASSSTQIPLPHD